MGQPFGLAHFGRRWIDVLFGDLVYNASDQAARIATAGIVVTEQVDTKHPSQFLEKARREVSLTKADFAARASRVPAPCLNFAEIPLAHALDEVLIMTTQQGAKLESAYPFLKLQ